MKENVFSAWAEVYFDRGFNVIPVSGKRPLIENWSRFKDVRLSREELSAWLGKFSGRGHADVGVGLVMGKFGGIAIDVDDERLVDFMPSGGNFYKRGAKGLTGVFRWRDGLVSSSSYKLDVLGPGRQTILPPSKHPNGICYEFFQCDGDVGLEDLEDISDEALADIIAASKMLEEEDMKAGKWRNDSAVAGAVGGVSGVKGAGRNQKLSEIAFAMASSGEVESEIARRLVEYDMANHLPPWFSDKNEEHGGRKKPEALAMDMARRAVKKVRGKPTMSVSSTGAATEIEEPTETKRKSIEDLGFQISTQVAGNSTSEAFLKLYDDAGPMIQYFWDYCRELSGKERPSMFLGAGVILCSTLASNNVEFMGGWPNLFMLNLAPSGCGKSFPQRALFEILTAAGCDGLLGDGEWRSFHSIYRSFEGKPKNVVLAIQDEVGSFFDKLDSQQGFNTVPATLSKAWSAGSNFLPATKIGDKNKSTPAIYNPCLNWTGFCTPDAVEGKVGTKFMMEGLGARLLYIFQPEVSDKDEDELRDFDTPAVNNDVIESVKYWLLKPARFKREANYASGSLGPIQPFKLTATEKVMAVVKEINKRSLEMKEAEKNLLLDDMGIERGSDHAKLIPPNNWKIACLNRRTEQIVRIAIAHWMSREAFNCDNADYSLRVVDLRWAESFYDAQFSGLESFSSLTFAGEYTAFSVPSVLLAEAKKYFARKAGEVMPYDSWYQRYWQMVKKFAGQGKQFDQIKTKTEVERQLEGLGIISFFYEENKKKIAVKK